MRRNKAFPGPGDRVRLAIPQLDDLPPLVRYGTVIEQSCGRSAALRVRWDDTARRSGFAADGGTEGWLADAGWYWDRGHLRVVNATEVEEVTVPARAAARPAPATEDDGWLTAGPRLAGPASQEGSVDAAAEWEAALASELEVGPEGDWDQLLARALGTTAPAVNPRPAAPARPAPAAARPTPPPAPPAPPAVSRPAPEAEVREATPPPAAAERPSEPPKPVQPWSGDDIIPRGVAKRRGRR